MPNMGPIELVIVLIALAVTVVLGCSGLVVMRGKGRSPGAGFALGFFLGIFGIVICYALSDKSLPAVSPAQPAWPPPPSPPDQGADIDAGRPLPPVG